MTNVLRVSLATTALSVIIAPAFAQQVSGATIEAVQQAVSAPDVTQSSNGQPSADIVVTGTLLRGIAPVGTNVIGLNRDDISATGATSTQQLMANIPQISNQFNGTPAVSTGVSGNTIVRPNIRNLAGNGGSTTLVLLDGHNMVGAGILTTTPDIGMIPPGALERVDVVPDGGSSLYGSDAIGGIVNLITRKHMNGVEVAGHLGTADPYIAGDVNVTAGRSWSSGSILLSYAYRANSDILGRNRSYFRDDLSPFGGTDNRTTACSPGTISANGTTYALPGNQAGTQNRCDTRLDSDIFPSEHQHSVFGSFEQQLSERLTFSLTGLYTNRKTVIASSQQRTIGGAITSANPFFDSVAGETAQSVSFSYDSARGPIFDYRTSIEEHELTPQLKYRLNDSWNVTLLGNYGQSVTTSHSPEINSAAESSALAATTFATALDPYDIAATNPSVLGSILNFEQYARNRQTLAEGRGLIDGTLVKMPGGDVRLALGSQYQYTQSDAVQTDAAPGDLTDAARAKVNRKVYAVFGELLVPIFGADNAVPGIRSLILDGSVRYDHYSDFGGTTNPKIGVTYKPFGSLTIRGNWGTSYNAPSLADTSGAVDTRAQVLSTSTNQKTFSAADLLRPTILLAGGNPDLKPQTAKTYSVGFDFKPEFARGLTLSATYYNVSLKNVIEVTPFYSPTIYTNPALAQYYTINPTLAQAQAIIGDERVQGPSLASLYATGNAPYAILTAERNNLGTLKVNGIDYNATYRTTTAIGKIEGSFGGTVTLHRTSTTVGSAPFDELANNGISRWQFVASIGDQIGALTVQARVNYSAGFRYPNIVNQDRVKAFAPLDLFFAYDLKGSGPLRGARLTLNVDNVFDKNPPFLNQGAGTANGQTFGRFFNAGVSWKL